MLLACAAIARAGAPLRVAIEQDVSDVVVGASGQDVLLTAGGEVVGDRPRIAPLRFGLREAPPAAPARRPEWSVHVRSESSRRKADMVKDALAQSLHAPLRVEPAAKGFAVVAGPFDQESRARAVVDDLEAAGMADVKLVAAELPPPPASSRLVVVTGLFKILDVPGESARIATPDGEPLLVDGKPYRGEIEVSINGRGLLNVISIVNLEDYLRGVVPEEMGPEVFPAIEALKAQAVAARTYALMPPPHGSEGFDLCSKPHCQVFGGLSSEHPLSDAAVQATAGMVLAWNGAPAHAYFSSTCGGHTEDVTNIFDEPPLPYLRGVPCYPESVEFLRLPGAMIPVDFQRMDGTTAHEVVARLLAVGVVTPDEAAAGVFSRRARSEEAAEWVRRAGRAAGISIDEKAAASVRVDTALGCVKSLCDAFGISLQAHLIDPKDVEAAARFSEMRGLSVDEIGIALLALKAGMLPDGLEPGWTTAKLSRGNVLELLERFLRAQGTLDGKVVRFAGSRDGQPLVLDGKDVVPLKLLPRTPLLSKRRDGRPRLREALDLKLLDKLRVLTDAAGNVSYVELEEDPDGAALDRTSSYSWWTRRIPLDQLQRQCEARGISGVRDARVARTSAAGRVVALELLDARGQRHLVEKFAVRELLGLPDLRAELHLERDASGKLEAITAVGRGWGHGVGLCQVGAFGLALEGSTYQQILAHYYPGTSLVPLTDLGR
jgi:stage II sporulation protein D